MSDSFKKNFKRRVNQSHKKKIFQVSSGLVNPSKEISLTDKGSVVFYENFFSPDKANQILEFCKSLDISVPSFTNSRNQVISQPRASIWYGPVPYHYSHYTLPNNSFSSTRSGWLEQVRQDMIMAFGFELNSCLVNLYKDGFDKVQWHADDESIFGENPTVVSLSFGVTRKFEICPKSVFPRKPKHFFNLVHGSVLIMKGDMQKNWLHRVPVDSKCKDVRYNLTFRNVVSP